ncbi:FtsK/SpoIIIE domain-containing protein [Quadrisphaera setariae]|uniref:FHA domain-containing protein n=1 Tax=Quadrisphaera setariae TaxID=2593304 RepID=A0A5C8ZKE7_9ACTN|nr:FtsK/SpoIIIE domain-containing protein [Quadrisphaera setariae]TXR58104.1 FHA domain-containing protein [Quadrisphaera setariae]
MRLELTAGGAGCCGPGADVVVEAPAGTPLREVLPQLAAAAGLGGLGAARVLVGGACVADDAPLGAPPLVRGARLVLGDDDESAAAAPSPGGALRVLSGPDAGSSARVPLGRSWVGRDAGGLVALTDPTASRRHVELDRTPAGTRVRDAGSANGTRLDGRLLGEAWTVLAPGALLQVGAGVLQVVAAPGPGLPPPPPATPDGHGRLVLGASEVPAAEEAPDTVEVVLPEPPQPRAGTPVAWAAVLAPALVAVPLALLWSPVALLLATTGPLVALVTAAGDRRRRRRDHVRALADHRDAVRRHHARAERALVRERSALELLHPAAGALLALVEARDPLLWSRPAEPRSAGGALRVRLGTARVPSGVVVRDVAEDDDGGGAPSPIEHEAGPLVVDLGGLRRVEVRGDAEAAHAAARALVCQLAVLHGPDRLELVLPAVPGPWRWARWLPHVLPPGAGTTAGGRDGQGGHDRGGAVARVAVGDGQDCLDGSWTSTGAGTTVVVLPGGEGGRSAGAPDAVLLVDSGGAATWSTAGTTTALVTDLLTQERAERLARALAPLRPAASAEGQVAPASPPLTEVLEGAAGLDALDPRAVARGWDGPRGRDLAVAVGVRASGGPWVLDLDRDGPHALVAGTTGAGKSSLLVAWLLALAVAVPPEELSVVLVDYKGGATAGRLKSLPHLAGCVTDLDEHLAQRALTSLSAEVRRRERVLAEHGVADRAELLRCRVDGARLLPRLLVVVDEVRVLVDEVPDLVPGLVRLATVGRSLGVHLVLATQRPAGAVSPDARANTNLRIALRVRDAPDSLDVLDDPGAAALPPDRPGAALVRRGGGGLEAVQVASLVRPPSVPVRVLAVGQVVPPGGEAVDEVPLLVASLRTAAAGRPRVSSPWLPPLPDLLPWRHPHDAQDGDADDDQPDAAGTALGLLDEPEVPAQRVLRWDATAPLAVCGGPGSGRTAALRWVAAASTGEVHVVGDPAEVADLAALPQVASTVDPDDGEHLLRVLQHLTDVPRSRRNGACGPRPLLLVDAADRVLAGRAAAGQRHEAEAAADLLAGLVTAGAPVLLTCDAASLTSRALASVREVLLLAPADRTAAVLAGVPSAATPVHWPPGRALRLRPGPLREVQLALLDPDLLRPGALVPAAPRPGLPSPDGAVRLGALPSYLALAELRALAPSSAPSSGAASPVVGLGGLRAAPTEIPLAAGSGALVVGPPGSGRSSALRLLAAQAAAAGRPCVLVQPRLPLPITAGTTSAPRTTTAAGGVPVVTGTDTAAGRALLAALAAAAAPPSRPAPAPLVLVDDAELLLGSPLEALLLDLADGDGPACAVVAAGTSGLLPTHRGLAAALRRHRTGLLLHPLAPGDAEVVGARAPVVRGGPRGRASLVRSGALVVVQLALP